MFCKMPAKTYSTKKNNTMVRCEVVLDYGKIGKKVASASKLFPSVSMISMPNSPPAIPKRTMVKSFGRVQFNIPISTVGSLNGHPQKTAMKAKVMAAIVKMKRLLSPKRKPDKSRKQNAKGSHLTKRTLVAARLKKHAER